MWIQTDGWGMTDDVIEQVRKEAPDALPIQAGECATWLNLDTGARMLHVEFGGHRSPGRSHGVFYRAPNGELFDIAHPVAKLNGHEMKYRPEDGVDREMFRAINIYYWRKVNHDIETTLGLRDDKFDGKWPGRSS